MPAAPLAEQAKEFARQMTDLVKATVSDDVDMTVVAVVGDEGSLFVIGSRIDTAGTNSVKQMVGDYVAIADLPEVALRAHWAFGRGEDYVEFR